MLLFNICFWRQPKTKHRDETLSSQSVLIDFLNFIQGVLNQKILIIALYSGKTCVKLKKDFLSK